jgi:Tfp pilus assembly protein PilE
MLIVVGIISILAMIAIPSYLGQQKRAARAEAYTNLENLRLLEEQFFAENGQYTPNLGVCAKDTNNFAAISAVLRGWRPGDSAAVKNTQFSYCIELDLNLGGGVQTNCFRARAFGDTGTRVDLDVFGVDCNNNRDF